MHNPEHQHALKEIDAAALAVVEDNNQVVKILTEDDGMPISERTKLWGLKHTPFEKTCYLDADMEVVRDEISEVWDLLDENHDVAFTVINPDISSLTLIIFIFLTGCAQSVAVLGPAVTVATTGNMSQALVSGTINTGIKHQTGKNVGEHMTQSFDQKLKDGRDKLVLTLDKELQFIIRNELLNSQKIN